jgi:phospholipase/lecithinase/hemolysin
VALEFVGASPESVGRGRRTARCSGARNKGERMKRLLAVLTLAAAAALPLPALAALTQLGNLFVFGDSLSDGGNSGLLTQQAAGVVFPPPPYAGGRYTNGLTAVEYLWNGYNPGNPGGFTPSLAGGTNYAIGGATTGVENWNTKTTSVPPVLQPAFTDLSAANELQQFKQFLANGGTFDPATSLFVVWLFPNDIFWLNGTGTLPTPIPNSPGGTDVVSNGIANIVTLVQTLDALGARNFLVPNLPDPAKTPDYLNNPSAAAALTQLTFLFNSNLKAQLNLLDANLPAKIVQFDVDAALGDIIATPSAFGFTNVTEKCVDNLVNGGCNPGSWLFWDGVHPTTYAHSILGAGFRAAVPEPGALALFALALSILLLGHARRLDRT